MYAVGLVIARSVAGRIYDRRGPKMPLVAGLVLEAAAFLTLGLAPTNVGLLAGAVVMGLGLGTLSPTVFAMAVNLVPPERRGAANATVFSALDLGIGTGANVLAGVVGLSGSYATMYLVCAALLALPAIVVFARVLPRYTHVVSHS